MKIFHLIMFAIAYILVVTAFVISETRIAKILFIISSSFFVKTFWDSLINGKE